MKFSLPEKITLERSLIYIIIAAVLITFAFIFFLFLSHFTRSIKITYPDGKEVLEVGQTYQVAWKASGVDKVGIVLFKGKEPKWIARDVSAGAGKYEWKIYPGEQYGDDYWVAVFEYPWKKGNKIDYSNGSFAVVYPELSSCDKLSIESGFTFVPSDYPDIRRVFITSESYTGNLNGLDGADKICQEEADKKGLEGKWHAFLGGDSDEEIAVERLRKTEKRGLDGVYVEAEPGATLMRGETCNRLLGMNFNDFKNNFSNLSILNEKKMSDDFFKNLSGIWIGRFDEKSKKTCAGIANVLNDPYKSSQEKYSLTVTCQNWTADARYVPGYPVASGAPKPSFPNCYTPQGAMTNAVMMAGFAEGFTGEGNNKAFSPYQGKECSTKQKILCIEE